MVEKKGRRGRLLYKVFLSSRCLEGKEIPASRSTVVARSFIVDVYRFVYPTSQRPSTITTPSGVCIRPGLICPLLPKDATSFLVLVSKSCTRLFLSIGRGGSIFVRVYTRAIRPAASQLLGGKAGGRGSLTLAIRVGLILTSLGDTVVAPVMETRFHFEAARYCCEYSWNLIVFLLSKQPVAPNSLRKPRRLLAIDHSRCIPPSC